MLLIVMYSIHNQGWVAMKTLTGLIVLLLLLAIGVPAKAQSAATPGVTKRQVQQQHRIKEGVRSGELTKKEAARLELQQARIQHDKKAAKADGVVTGEERKKLAREQNRSSKTIFRKKHNARDRKP
jgi:hypothetical protein